VPPPPVCNIIMYKVTNNLTSTYGEDPLAMKSKGPDMPHFTTGNKRMTNVPVGNGEYISGIRRNENLGKEELIMSGQSQPMDYDMAPVKPLRYTPGLKCDAHLESLRPSRDPRNPPIQGGDQWKKKLIPAPNTYEGSFAEADMNKFRPVPAPNPAEDPWYATRLPDPYMTGVDRLAMPFHMGAAPYGDPSAGAYNQMYPQDELSMIKMRNRRFQHAVAMDQMSLQGGGMPPMMPGQPMPHPGMMGMQGMMPMAPLAPMAPPPPTAYAFDHEVAKDELASIDHDLNMTRRATRPFVPSQAPNYWSLQRQVQQMEDEPPKPVSKPLSSEITSVEQLPRPKPVSRAPMTEAFMAQNPTEAKNAARNDVRIADQIAIRSFVLGPTVPKIGGSIQKAEPEPARKSKESPI